MPKSEPFKEQKQRLPLYKELDESKSTLVVKQLKKLKKKDPDHEDDFVDAKMTRKILALARDQQNEIDSEIPLHMNDWRTIGRDSLNNPDIDSDDASGQDDCTAFSPFDEEDVNILNIDAADQELFEKFMPFGTEPRQSLADLILEKINQQVASQPDRSKECNSLLPPKVIEVYSKVGILLSRYRSGKLPKAFKIIPSLQRWEEILLLTRPDRWSPHACYEATRIFVSNLKATQTQRFLSMVLLDRVRDDIASTKKLHYHLYMALRKALYKPAAWFKGFLFPLCQTSCTLREAAIVASVLTKVSVPALHSSAALLRLAEMDYTGPISLFIRVLIDKKYALPYKVIDALVFHFLRFKSDSRVLPVLWHQAFLAFAQRYKNDTTPEQKDALYEVVNVKGHHAIGPIIRKELASGVVRGEAVGDVDMLLI